jgi:dTDP-4-dehydrorhamnose 3,5-epimerase-like enzyme
LRATFCQEASNNTGSMRASFNAMFSYNRRNGTLRGMHYQIESSGSIYDVVIHLRPDSATYYHWLAVKISACRLRSMLYIPQNFAHGFRRWRMTRKYFTRCRSSIIRSQPGAFGEMTQHLLSSGAASSPLSPKGTGASRISCNERDS